MFPLAEVSMVRRALRLGTPLLILLTQCTRRPDQAAAQLALLAADRAFAQATVQRGAEGWADYFAPDALQFTGARQVQGPAQIREHMRTVLSEGNRLTWEPTHAFLSEEGDLGYTIGRWEFSPGQAAPAHGGPARGSYVTIWRRQADGAWKVVLDIGNSDEPER